MRSLIFPDSPGHIRHRGLYLVLIAVVILSGLASRSELLGLPAFFAKYTGDALWGLMIFLGLGFLMPHRRTLMLAGLAALVCCIVELSQLYQASWLDAVRQTWIGRMTLGNTFGWGDILAYIVGIGLGAMIELMVRYAKIENRVQPSSEIG